MTKSDLFYRLHRVEDIDAKLRCVKMKIERLESCLQGHAIRYDTDKVQTSPQDPVAEVMASLDKLLDQKKRLDLEMVQAVDDTAALIDALKDNRQRLILHYRYMACLPWSIVAKRVRLSDRHVFRLHDQAIDWLAKNL